MVEREEPLAVEHYPTEQTVEEQPPVHIEGSLKNSASCTAVPIEIDSTDRSRSKRKLEDGRIQNDQGLEEPSSSSVGWADQTPE